MSVFLKTKKSDIKHLEDEIDLLKSEIKKLRKDVETKTNELSKQAVQKVDLGKLIKEFTGNTTEVANILELLKDIFEKNIHLKDRLKMLESPSYNIVEPEEETYPCEQCDVDFYCEDALETHYELYHENEKKVPNSESPGNQNHDDKAHPKSTKVKGKV